jgi:hypothetical protein
MSVRNIFLALVFLIPCLLVSLPGMPPWLARAIAVSVLVLGGTSFFFLAGLVPKLKLVSVGPKLLRPEFDAIRPKLERNLRLFVLALGAFMFFFVTLPVTEDIIHLCAGEKPVQIFETPRSTSTLFGAWFLVQFVRFSSAEGNNILLYSVNRVRAGRKYEFLVLPRSHLIMDFHELQG